MGLFRSKVFLSEECGPWGGFLFLVQNIPYKMSLELFPSLNDSVILWSLHWIRAVNDGILSSALGKAGFLRVENREIPQTGDFWHQERSIRVGIVG